uniref:Uncharacterized protein n=1 Tax=Candidatus Kentrum sp. FW TaxID=2126338 RepID=A0A450T6K0_9GAMM|nr:MAG: hypothetical protein BECKFW1821C_GA0114237_100231 [Candidatus Kentron sp. FW]
MKRSIRNRALQRLPGDIPGNPLLFQADILSPAVLPDALVQCLPGGRQPATPEEITVIGGFTLNEIQESGHDPFMALEPFAVKADDGELSGCEAGGGIGAKPIDGVHKAPEIRVGR